VFIPTKIDNLPSLCIYLLTYLLFYAFDIENSDSIFSSD